MTDRFERLTNLLAVLRDTRRPLTLEEIVDRVPGYPSQRESARRQFERDKDTLRGIGVPIAVEQVDALDPTDVGYRVRPEEYELPSLDLTGAERAALHAAVAAVRLDGEEGREALWKLGGLEGEELPALAGLPVVPALADLLDASGRCAQVRFRYRGQERHLDPYAITFRRGHWYVVGHDHDRGELRSFRADRIEGPVEAGSSGAFARPEGFDADVVLHDEPWRYGEEAPVEALVELDAVVAPWVVARLGPGAVTELRGGAAVVRLTVTNRDAFRSFVLGLLDHAVVLGPPELRREVLEWLRAMAGEGPPGAGPVQ